MKSIITIFILLISSASFSQVYVAGGGTTNGVEVGAGVLAQDVDIQFSYNMPLTSTVKPMFATLTVGRMFIISDKEDYYNYSITPSVGIVGIDKNIFNKDETEIIEKQKLIKPAFLLELGKDSFGGRFVISAAYSDRFYFGFKVRGFFR